MENTKMKIEAESVVELESEAESDANVTEIDDSLRKLTMNSFYRGNKPDLEEVYRFSRFLKYFEDRGMHAFENIHLSAQATEATIERTTGERMHLINMSNYNYLGMSSHPAVIQAAKDAIDQYGLGAASAPMIGGTLGIHKELEHRLRDFFGCPESDGVSLFTTGYNVNVGTISAIMKPGTHVILDKCVHMSILEGAKLSGATIHHHEHNNLEQLEEIAKSLSTTNRRVLICTEGVYSADGDYSNIKEIVRIAKQYGAMTLVDEAHSVLVAGPNGKGVCEEQGVLADIDFYVMTFSKGFGSIGGAVVAKKEIARYIDYYARCRMFSCAICPSVAGSVIKAIDVAASPEGAQRREHLRKNCLFIKSLLLGKVDILDTDSWVIPVVYGDEKLTPDINEYLQRQGLEAGLMTFPAVPRGQARIRIFVTSEHTEDQLTRAAHIILKAAKQFNFLLNE